MTNVNEMNEIRYDELTPDQKEQFAKATCLPVCQELICVHNQLTSLPALPVCKVLNCSDNQLAALPELPVCQVLNCNNNQIISLPALPVCQMLSCYNNQLTSLPELPVCRILLCGYNQLTSLPVLPVCELISCRNNPLFYSKTRAERLGLNYPSPLHHERLRDLYHCLLNRLQIWNLLQKQVNIDAYSSLKIVQCI